LNISEDLKDAKIAELLEHYTDLDKKISELPNAIKQTVEDISKDIHYLPEKADEKLQGRFEEVNTLINNLIEATEASKSKLERDGEVLRLKVAENLEKQFQDYFKVHFRHPFPRWGWVALGFGFIVAATAISVGSVAWYNQTTLELTTKERDYYMNMNGADARADLKTIEALNLSPEMKEKYDTLYNQNYEDEFSAALQRAGLSKFRPQH